MGGFGFCGSLRVGDGWEPPGFRLPGFFQESFFVIGRESIYHVPHSLVCSVGDARLFTQASHSS